MKRFLLFAIVIVLSSLHVAAQHRAHSSVSGKLQYFPEAIFSEKEIALDSSFAFIPNPVIWDTLQAWRQWTVVENFSFGKDRGSLTMITDLHALHPYFRDKIKDLIIRCGKLGIELAVVETYRTHAKQNEYRMMGRKYTNSVGGKSKHQYGLAVDVVPIVNGVAVWDNLALWKRVGMQGENLGLRWGGRWKKPYDPGHFEWTGGLASTHLASGILPKVPEDRYPCIHEDISMLKTYWNFWEDYQREALLKSREQVAGKDKQHDHTF